jgi:hypothetical protein
MYIRPVRLSLSAESASHSTVFFSHNKSANSTLSQLLCHTVLWLTLTTIHMYHIYMKATSYLMPHFLSQQRVPRAFFSSTSTRLMFHSCTLVVSTTVMINTQERWHVSYDNGKHRCWVKSSSQMTQFTQSSKHFRQDKVVSKVVFISWSFYTCQRGYL